VGLPKKRWVTAGFFGVSTRVSEPWHQPV